MGDSFKGYASPPFTLEPICGEPGFRQRVPPVGAIDMLETNKIARILSFVYRVDSDFLECFGDPFGFVSREVV